MCSDRKRSYYYNEVKIIRFCTRGYVPFIKLRFSSANFTKCIIHVLYVSFRLM